MKKLSIILNIVLFVLVAVLFYLHFAAGKATSSRSSADTVQDSAARAPLRIAFVNIDSLEAHYSYFQEKSRELAKKQKAIQNELGSRAKEIQNEITQLQKKGPTLTQSEGEAAQKRILKKRQDLQKREQDLQQQFMKEQQEFNADLHTRLDNFLKQYNADEHYTYILSYSLQGSDILYKDAAYDITADVIKGLNSEENNAGR